MAENTPSFRRALEIIAEMGDNNQLDLGGLDLEQLPELPARVKILNCDRNKLSYLPPLPAGLKELNCTFNSLIELPILPTGLKKMMCVGNGLTILPELPLGLEELNCSQNNLTRLPKLPLGLKILICSFNNLTELPTLPPKLNILWCYNNKLTTLPDLPLSLDNYEVRNPIMIHNNPLRPPFTTVKGTRAYYAELRNIQTRGRNVSSLKTALGKPDTLNSAIQRSGRENIITSFLSGKPAGISLENQLTALKGNYNRILTGPNAAGAGASRKGGRRRKTQRRKRTQKRR